MSKIVTDKFEYKDGEVTGQITAFFDDKDGSIRKHMERRYTSMMMYPLEAPIGWFLELARHEHTGIRYATDFHEPLPHAAGPWLVQFQKYPKGGLLTQGRGHSLEEAWANATKAVEARDAEER